MTFSIVARSEDGTHLGVAVASKFLAVGAAVPAARAGHGALATQAWANLGYKAEGLTLLADGLDAHATIDALIAGDDMREHRQVGVVDAHGNSETYTGPQCMEWAGGLSRPGYAIQGNILTGEEVVTAIETAWLATDRSQPFSRRLLAALAAGDAAGGDSRGRQSAALYVVTPGGGYGGGTDVQVDLRVDDHAAPIPELERLLGLHDLLFGEPDPDALLDLSGELLTEVRDRLAAQGFPSADDSVAAAETALARWAGRENLEERIVEGKLDPVVLDYMRSM
ncbi:MAG TPA: DUF1028 domain-containing protein [Actinocrinis sp.]|nr:DUF1028 domain-containing protein [Actinocrinis sp.]